jgi:hypothetical protein
MSTTQLLSIIALFVVLVINAHLVAATVLRKPELPPGQKSVRRICVLLADIVLLLGLCGMLLLIGQRPGAPSHADVAASILLGVLLTLHGLIVFHRWIRPKIGA